MNVIAAATQRWPWFPYAAPMVAFLVLTSLESVLAPAGDTRQADIYPWLYLGKLAIVSVVAWLCRSTWRDLLPIPNWRVLAIAALVGLLVAYLWVLLDPITPRFALLGGTRSGFDPTQLGREGEALFLIARFAGLVLLVPLIEELFWRSFLVRWVINAEFEKVSIGKVTVVSAAATSCLFALAHPEWLAALITGYFWVGLLWWSKSISACVVSHMVANLALGGYVLTSGRWEFL